jgi:hypothetical protein
MSADANSWSRKIQEPWIQKVHLGFLLTDPTKKNPTLALVCSEAHFLFAYASKIPSKS